MTRNNIHLHPLAAIVSNESGVLSSIAGLFTNRGFNIASLAVGETETEGYSRMTIIVRGDDRDLEQVEKQLNKQVDVIKVSDLDKDTSVVRELCLVKVNAQSEQKKMLLMK